MMRAVLYDTRSGHIIAVGDAESMLRRMGDHADIVAFSQGASDASHYVTDGAVTPREEWASAALDRADILADGVDAATLSGLPDPCWVSIDGAPEVTVVGALYIAAARPGQVKVEMLGRWRAEPWIITAHDLAALKTKAKARIDAAAEAERMKYITAGDGQALVYDRKRFEAEQINTGRGPRAADNPLLAADAAATGRDLRDVAAEVLAASDRWIAAAAVIERKRLAAKRAVDAAATVTAVIAAEAINWTE